MVEELPEVWEMKICDQCGHKIKLNEKWAECLECEEILCDYCAQKHENTMENLR